MSRPKRKQSPFLLSKLKPLDYLLFFGAMVLLVVIFLLVPNVLNTLKEANSALEANRLPPQSVPARSIQRIHNISQLWSKDEYIAPIVDSSASLFFALGEQTLIYTAENKPERTTTLEVHDIVSGQTRWQTSIPDPAVIRMYDNKLFVLTTDWLGQALAIDKQELPYCSFWQSPFSLAAYDVDTGQQIWGYGYRGANSSQLYFQNQNVYLRGTENHGNSRLVIDIDVDSGFIVNQSCGKNGDSNPVPHVPTDYGGISGTAFSINSVDEQEVSSCSKGNRYCFVAEGNRLRVLDGNSDGDLAYIEFGGATLTHYDIDVLVHNSILVVHLDDSDQLFAFRLP